MTLLHKKVLITREKKQAQAFAQQVERLGAQAVIADVLTINCTAHAIQEKLSSPLSTFDWLFFTSANGVDCFFNGLEAKDDATFQHVKIAVVGTKTNDALQRHGKQATFTPSIYNAKTMGHEFLKAHPTPGKLLLVQGSKARPELVNIFTEKGCDFERLEVYQTETNKEGREPLENVLSNEWIDYLTFTSPSAVDAFCELTKLPVSSASTVVCIGTTTEKRALEHGFQQLLVPENFTIEGMLEVMTEHARKRGTETYE